MPFEVLDSRDAFGDKDVSLTTKIALRGRYAVLTHGGMGLGVSRKIPEEKRALLKDRVLSSEEFADIQKRIYHEREKIISQHHAFSGS